MTSHRMYYCTSVGLRHCINAFRAPWQRTFRDPTVTNKMAARETLLYTVCIEERGEMGFLNVGSERAAQEGSMKYQYISIRLNTVCTH